MNKIILGALLCALCGSAAAQEWSMSGTWQQGTVVQGRATPGTQVWFNGRKLSLTPQGEFIIGLDRDEPAEAEVKVQTAKDPMPITYRYGVLKRPWDIQRVDGLPDDKVNPPASALPRIQREQKMIREAHVADLPRGEFAQQMQWPVLGRISGVFGNQRILNGVPKQPHYGTDVAVPTGTKIMAPLGGVVVLAEPDLYYTGGTIMIDHGHGLSTIMVHLSKLLVKQGEEVQQGQTIAESGMTGRATGPHLHWGVYWFNSRIDGQTMVPTMPASAGAKP